MLLDTHTITILYYTILLLLYSMLTLLSTSNKNCSFIPHIFLKLISYLILIEL